MNQRKEKVIVNLFDSKVISFGNFTLRSGLRSPIYVDMRRIMGFPNLLIEASMLVYDTFCNETYDNVCGVPLGGIPFAVTLATHQKIPALFLRKEAKTYGMCNKIEGVVKRYSKCVIIEDVITTGQSIIGAMKDLLVEEIDPTVATCFFTYLSPKECETKKFRYVINIFDVISTLAKYQKISKETTAEMYKLYRFDSRFGDTQLKELLFEEQIGVRLCQALRKSRMCLSLDISDKDSILEMLKLTGDNISILKLHSDIISEFDDGFIRSLKWYSKTKNFLLMEDRKFCDIGATVQKQMNGQCKIADWADLVTVHALAGAGTIEAILQVSPHVGIVIVVEMSCEGTLTTVPGYQEGALKLAEQFKKNVVGIVAQRRLSNSPTLFTFTPGISGSQKTDSLGQRYSTPSEAVSRGADFLIVGRSIYESDNPLKQLASFDSL